MNLLILHDQGIAMNLIYSQNKEVNRVLLISCSRWFLGFVAILAINFHLLFFENANKSKNAKRSSASVDEFSFVELKNLIAKEKIRTIESLIPKLPPILLRNYTLMHSSQSTQESSPEFPRVIMFHPNGKLILAYNGDPKLSAFNELELAEFDFPF